VDGVGVGPVVVVAAAAGERWSLRRRRV